MADVLRVDSALVGRASVVQLIESHALSGRLVVEVAGAEAGWADFLDGRPIAAQRGAARGLDALYDLLTIDAGITRFQRFDPGREPAPGKALADVLSLVMEGCRLRDEYVRLGELVLAPLGHVPPDLPNEVHQVLRRVDGQATLTQAIGEAGVSPSRVVDALRHLLEKGVLQRAPGRSPPTPPGGPLTFHDALESGRRHFRDGNLERAERDLLAALGQRPEDRIALQNLRRVREVRARRWIERIPSS